MRSDQARRNSLSFLRWRRCLSTCSSGALRIPQPAAIIFAAVFALAVPAPASAHAAAVAADPCRVALDGVELTD